MRDLPSKIYTHSRISSALFPERNTLCPCIPSLLIYSNGFRYLSGSDSVVRTLSHSNKKSRTFYYLLCPKLQKLNRLKCEQHVPSRYNDLQPVSIFIMPIETFDKKQPQYFFHFSNLVFLSTSSLGTFPYSNFHYLFVLFLSPFILFNIWRSWSCSFQESIILTNHFESFLFLVVPCFTNNISFHWEIVLQEGITIELHLHIFSLLSHLKIFSSSGIRGSLNLLPAIML